jgi:hypothetical protein
MRELFKQYNEEIIKKKLLVGGEIFFITYSLFEETKVYVDTIFINQNNRSMGDIRKILEAIEVTFSGKGVEQISISLLFNVPYLAEVLSVLLEKGYKNQFANEQGLILTKE